MCMGPQLNMSTNDITISNHQNPSPKISYCSFLHGQSTVDRCSAADNTNTKLPINLKLRDTLILGFGEDDVEVLRPLGPQCLSIDGRNLSRPSQKHVQAEDCTGRSDQRLRECKASIFGANQSANASRTCAPLAEREITLQSIQRHNSGPQKLGYVLLIEVHA